MVRICSDRELGLKPSKRPSARWQPISKNLRATLECEGAHQRRLVFSENRVDVSDKDMRPPNEIQEISGYRRGGGAQTN
jgi:hypothetical protein